MRQIMGHMNLNWLHTLSMAALDEMLGEVQVAREERLRDFLEITARREARRLWSDGDTDEHGEPVEIRFQVRSQRPFNYEPTMELWAVQPDRLVAERHMLDVPDVLDPLAELADIQRMRGHGPAPILSWEPIRIPLAE